MPRQPRKKSFTGTYHVMLRGIDGRNLFLEPKDKDYFVQKMFDVKEKVDFSLYGYCLMDNHVHLLLDESEELGTTIKRIAVGYVQWHNTKYGRTGHLFQNRYRSETVESEEYLKTVLRYIHKNPVKAKLVNRLEEYPWSSYREYIKAYDDKRTSLDVEFMFGFFSSITEFKSFMGSDNDDVCLDYEEKKKYSNIEVENIIQTRFNLDSNSILNLPKEIRNELVKSIYSETGISIRQISDVTGLGRRVVERALKGDKRNVPVSPS